MATHSSILGWEIPWREEPGGLQAMGSLRVERHYAHTHTHAKYTLHILLENKVLKHIKYFKDTFSCFLKYTFKVKYYQKKYEKKVAVVKPCGVK